MESDESLRVLFQNPEYESVLLETGYRKPLMTLQMADKTTIKQTLKAQVLLRVKAELDQFCEGLRTCEVIEYTWKYPTLMAPRFMWTLVSLTQGRSLSVNIMVDMHLCIWRRGLMWRYSLHYLCVCVYVRLLQDTFPCDFQ